MLYMADPIEKGIYVLKFKGDEPLATDGWFVEIHEEKNKYTSWLCKENEPLKVFIIGAGIDACDDLDGFCFDISAELADGKIVSKYNRLMGR